MQGNGIAVGHEVQPALLPFSLDRMVRAVELVRERLLRAAKALDAGGVAYAVVGGNAVGAWVARRDIAAVRNTADVDVLLRRADLDAATRAMEQAGFVRAEVMGIEMFLDGADGRVRDAVHILFAGEKVRPDYAHAAPEVSESERAEAGYQMVGLEPLVRMKLTSPSAATLTRRIP